MNALPLLAALLLLASPADARSKKPPAKPPAAAVAAKAPPPAVLTPAEASVVDAVMSHSPPPAEYLFLLDTSGEMLDNAKAALPQIAGIVERLPAGDSVEVVAFHTRPTVALDRVKIDDLARSTLVERIRALELTSAKDSDLGAGLAYAVSRLNRADAAPMQFVFLMSTFCHSPSIASDYDSGGRGCRAIRGMPKLVEAFNAGRKERTLVATLFDVLTPSVPKDATGRDAGLAAAKSLFGDPTVIETSATPFDTWAAEYRRRAPLERVLPLITADAKNAALSLRILRPPTAQKPVAQVEVSAGTRYVPVKLTGVTIGGEVSGGVPADLDLAPAATLEVAVKAPESPLAFFPGEDLVPLPITLSATGALVPAEGLAAIGVDPARPGMTATVSANWKRTYGLPIWLVGILFLGLAAMAAGGGIFLRRRLRVVHLEGSFSYRRPGGPRMPLEIGSTSEIWIALRPDGELELRKQGAVLGIRMVKQGLDAYAEAEILADGVEINRKPARRGRHRVVAGASSFQFGDYRVSWE